MRRSKSTVSGSGLSGVSGSAGRPSCGAWRRTSCPPPGYRLNGEQPTTAEYCQRLGLLRMKPKGRGWTLKLAKLGRGWPHDSPPGDPLRELLAVLVA